ncbi:MAG: hypothetical protein CME65_14720 [Halobacteriovoraceae bacterium]|nr:hypothetical protein [Halobacteriovoraceae bacterium]|tara:strand:+ start:2535 stop:3284 length:750 start_codon:yes stop_codon:yes gene_type:complete
MSLKVFITGGTTGIGLALAKKFLAEGAIVAVTGRSQEKYNAIRDKRIIFYQSDVAKSDQMKVCVEHFIKHQGGLDIIIANAGIGYSEKSAIPNFAESKRIFEVNVFGVMNTIEPALEYFHQKGSGHVVCISSIAGFNGLPGTSAYAASKSAVSKLFESYAIDFKQSNIDVTCIHPGFVDTPLTQRNKHPMPFIVSATRAGDKFYSAIMKKKSYYAYPRFFSGLVRFLSFLPRSLYISMMRSKFLNYSVK